MKRFILGVLSILILAFFPSVYSLLQNSQRISSYGSVQYNSLSSSSNGDYYRWTFDIYPSNQGPLGGWVQVGSGTIRVVKDSSAPSKGVDNSHGDCIEITSPQNAEPYIFAGESWEDFVISARVKVVSSGPGAVGIYFRYVDSSNWYYFRYGWHDKLFMVYKYINGNLEGITSKKASLALNTWHNWTIQVKGWKVSCLINQTFIFANQDLTGHDLPQGKIALFTWNSTTAHFDNVIYKKSELRLPNHMVFIQLGTRNNYLLGHPERGLALAKSLGADGVDIFLQDTNIDPATLRRWIYPFFEAGYYIILAGEYMTDFGYSKNPYIWANDYYKKNKNETLVRYEAFTSKHPDSNGFIKLSFDTMWGGGIDAWDIYNDTSPYGDGRKLNAVKDTTISTWVNYLGLNATPLAWEHFSNSSGTYICLYNGTNPVDTTHAFDIYYMTRFRDFMAPTYRNWLNVFKPRFDDLIGNYSMYMDGFYGDCSSYPIQGIANYPFLKAINDTYLPGGYFSMKDPDGPPLATNNWDYQTYYEGPTRTYNQQLYYRTVIMGYLVNGLFRNMTNLFHANYISLGYSTSETQQNAMLSGDAGWDFSDNWVNDWPWGIATGQPAYKPLLIASYCVRYQGQSITDWGNSLFRSLMSSYGFQNYGSLEWWLSTCDYQPTTQEKNDMKSISDKFHEYWSLINDIPKPLMNLAKFYGYYNYSINYLQGGTPYGNLLISHLPINFTRYTYWDMNFSGGVPPNIDVLWAWTMSPYGWGIGGPLDKVLDTYVIPWLNNGNGALILPRSEPIYSSRFTTSEYDAPSGNVPSYSWTVTQAYKAIWEARLKIALLTLGSTSLSTSGLIREPNSQYWDRLYYQTSGSTPLLLFGFRTYGDTGRIMSGKFPANQKDFPNALARNSTDNSFLYFILMFYRGLLWLGRLENATIFALEGDYTGFVLNSTKDMGIFCMADIFGDTNRPYYTFNITGIGNTFLIYNFTDNTVSLHSNPVTAYLPASAGRYYAVRKYNPSSVNLLYIRRYADASTKTILNMGEISLVSDLQMGLRHTTVINGNLGINASLTYYIPSGLYSNDVFTISCNETSWGYTWDPSTRLLKVWMILENSGSLSIDSGTGTGAPMSNVRFYQDVLLSTSPRELEDYEEVLLSIPRSGRGLLS